VKGSSRDYVAVYLEAADAASAPSGWKRYVEFRLGVVSQVRGVTAVFPVAHPLTWDYRSISRFAVACFQTHVEGQSDKSVWRTGQHEFNSETSDGTWGFSQARPQAEIQCAEGPYA
jgi:hypothetical protein